MIDQQTDRASSSVSLVIPCRPEYVALCRLVAGSLGVRDRLDEEVVSDIKVIVTEACNCFLAMAGKAGAGEPAGCSVRMDFDSRPDAFVISVLSPERRDVISWLEGCDSMSEAGLALTILKSLTDEMVEVDSQAEGTVLRLTKFLPA